MDVKELRIGNLIHFNGSREEVGVVTGIVESVFDSPATIYLNYRIDITTSTDKTNPIPLTEEWLLRFGFKNTDTGFEIKAWRENDFNIILVGHKYAVPSSSGFFGLVNTSHINYIHQLQNLYFAITGKELTLQ